MGDIIHTVLLTVVITVDLLAKMVQEILRAMSAKAA